MKIRNGFVSNSSSSSFTCNVCGGTQSGMDACLSDFGMEECVNGHIFCESHRVKDTGVSPLPLEMRRSRLISAVYNEAVRASIRGLDFENQGDIDQFEEIWEDYAYDLNTDSIFCPICQFKNVCDRDVIPYLLNKLSWTEEQLLSNISDEFEGEYTNFMKWLKE